MLFPLALLGNLLVLALFIRNRYRLNTLDIYIINLVLSELSFTLVVPFISHGEFYNNWSFGPIVCKVVHFYSSLYLYIHGFTLCCYSIYHYLSVAHTSWLLQHHKLIHTYTACMVIWLLAVALSVVDARFYSNENDADMKYCTRFILSYHSFNDIYISAGFACLKLLLGFFTPFIVILISACGAGGALAYAPAARRRRAREFSAVAGTFFLCWFPYNVCDLLVSLSWLGDETETFDCAFEYAMLVYCLPLTRSMAFLYCCIVPILHVLRKRRQRAQLKHMGRRLTELLRQQLGSRNGSQRRDAPADPSSK
uniref:atypical chemokine receptor 2-like n=1 Tax=Myxine glutinosa TaxID=7769 RepID=UPI00358F43AD